MYTDPCKVVFVQLVPDFKDLGLDFCHVGLIPIKCTIDLQNTRQCQSVHNTRSVDAQHNNTVRQQHSLSVPDRILGDLVSAQTIKTVVASLKSSTILENKLFLRLNR